MRYFLLIAVLVLDFATKYAAQAYLPTMSASSHEYPYGGIPVFKNVMGIEFSITHATNRGAAWGVGSAYQNWLFALRVVLISAIVVYALFWNKDRGQSWGYMLIIAGAVGNLIDYFVYGHVIDMLHFVLWGYDFPVFNIADSAIFLGVCWLLLKSRYDASHRLSAI